MESWMIVWKGWGFLVVVFAVIAFLLGAFVGNQLIGLGPHRSGGRYGAAIGFAIAAALTWLIGRSLNRPIREAKAGLSERHSFCLIPMEWCSIGFLVLALLFALMAGE
jgi:hypothetical protein